MWQAACEGVGAGDMCERNHTVKQDIRGLLRSGSLFCNSSLSQELPGAPVGILLIASKDDSHPPPFTT